MPIITLTDYKELLNAIDTMSKEKDPGTSESAKIKKYQDILNKHLDLMMKKNNNDQELSSNARSRAIKKIEKKFQTEAAKLLHLQAKCQDKIEEINTQINGNTDTVDIKKINANKKEIEKMQASIDEHLKRATGEIPNFTKDFQKKKYQKYQKDTEREATEREAENIDNTYHGLSGLLSDKVQEEQLNVQSRLDTLTKDLETKFKGPYRIRNNNEITIKGQRIKIRQLNDDYRTEADLNLDALGSNANHSTAQESVISWIKEKIEHYQYQGETSSSESPNEDPAMHRHRHETNNTYWITTAKNGINNRAAKTIVALNKYKEAIDNLKKSGLTIGQKRRAIRNIKNREKELLQHLNGTLDKIDVSDITSPKSIAIYEKQALLPRLSPDSPEAKAYIDLFNALHKDVMTTIKDANTLIKTKENEKGAPETRDNIFIRAANAIRDFFNRITGRRNKEKATINQEVTPDIKTQDSSSFEQSPEQALQGSVSVSTNNQEANEQKGSDDVIVINDGIKSVEHSMPKLENSPVPKAFVHSDPRQHDSEVANRDSLDSLDNQKLSSSVNNTSLDDDEVANRDSFDSLDNQKLSSSVNNTSLDDDNKDISQKDNRDFLVASDNSESDKISNHGISESENSSTSKLSLSSTKDNSPTLDATTNKDSSYSNYDVGQNNFAASNSSIKESNAPSVSSSNSSISMQTMKSAEIYAGAPTHAPTHNSNHQPDTRASEHRASNSMTRSEDIANGSSDLENYDSNIQDSKYDENSSISMQTMKSAEIYAGAPTHAPTHNSNHQPDTRASEHRASNSMTESEDIANGSSDLENYDSNIQDSKYDETDAFGNHLTKNEQLSNKYEYKITQITSARGDKFEKIEYPNDKQTLYVLPSSGNSINFHIHPKANAADKTPIEVEVEGSVDPTKSGPRHIVIKDQLASNRLKDFDHIKFNTSGLEKGLTVANILGTATRQSAKNNKKPKPVVVVPESTTVKQTGTSSLHSTEATTDSTEKNKPSTAFIKGNEDDANCFKCGDGISIKFKSANIYQRKEIGNNTVLLTSEGKAETIKIETLENGTVLCTAITGTPSLSLTKVTNENGEEDKYTIDFSINRQGIDIAKDTTTNLGNFSKILFKPKRGKVYTSIDTTYIEKYEDPDTIYDVTDVKSDSGTIEVKKGYGNPLKVCRISGEPVVTIRNQHSNKEIQLLLKENGQIVGPSNCNFAMLSNEFPGLTIIDQGGNNQLQEKNYITELDLIEITAVESEGGKSAVKTSVREVGKLNFQPAGHHRNVVSPNNRNNTHVRYDWERGMPEITLESKTLDSEGRNKKVTIYITEGNKLVLGKDTILSDIQNCNENISIGQQKLSDMISNQQYETYNKYQERILEEAQIEKNKGLINICEIKMAGEKSGKLYQHLKGEPTVTVRSDKGDELTFSIKSNEETKETTIVFSDNIDKIKKEDFSNIFILQLGQSGAKDISTIIKEGNFKKEEPESDLQSVGFWSSKTTTKRTEKGSAQSAQSAQR